MTNGAATPALAAKTDADRFLSQFWSAYAESRHGGPSYVISHPIQSARAWRAIRRRPVITAGEQSDTPGGREVRRVIDQKGPLGLPARWWGFAILPVLHDPSHFLESPEAKRLRRNLRLAQAAGISVHRVAAGDRDALLEQANHREQNHPDPTYRVAQPRNEDLLDHDLWLVATDRCGKPLLLAVAAVDGEFAILRYFRTLLRSERHSLSRYSAHQALVEELSRRNVRWLMDTDPPAAQTNGVRLYQRIVGFRYMTMRRPIRRRSK